MPFVKGNKYGKGRVPGKPNVFTEKLKKKLEFVLDLCLETAEEDVRSLKPYERITLVKDLSEYKLPKYQRIEGQVMVTETKIIKVLKPADLAQLAEEARTIPIQIENE